MRIHQVSRSSVLERQTAKVLHHLTSVPHLLPLFPISPARHLVWIRPLLVASACVVSFLEAIIPFLSLSVSFSPQDPFRPTKLGFPFPTEPGHVSLNFISLG